MPEPRIAARAEAPDRSGPILRPAAHLPVRRLTSARERARRRAGLVARRVRGTPADAAPAGTGGAEEPSGPLFDWPFYQRITEARQRHLESLDLPVTGRSVLDVGSGIGRLSEFFAERGCDVLCVDGRAENIERLRALYPGRRAAVVDVETDALLDHGVHDVVFCYGLLYHLADPMGFIRRAARVCGELMIIETCIADAEEPMLFLVRDPDDPTMALHRIASRPSPAYVAIALRLAGFEHVYSPTTLPDHEDFDYRRLGDRAHLRDGRVMRDVFVASRSPLRNRRLRPLEDH